MVNHRIHDPHVVMVGGVVGEVEVARVIIIVPK